MLIVPVLFFLFFHVRAASVKLGLAYKKVDEMVSWLSMFQAGARLAVCWT